MVVDDFESQYMLQDGCFVAKIGADTTDDGPKLNLLALFHRRARKRRGPAVTFRSAGIFPRKSPTTSASFFTFLHVFALPPVPRGWGPSAARRSSRAGRQPYRAPRPVQRCAGSPGAPRGLQIRTSSISKEKISSKY